MDQHFASQLFNLMKKHFVSELPNHHHLSSISFLKPLQPSTFKKTTISLLIVNSHELDQKHQRKRKKKKKKGNKTLH